MIIKITSVKPAISCTLQVPDGTDVQVLEANYTAVELLDYYTLIEDIESTPK